MEQLPLSCPFCQNPITTNDNKSYSCRLNHCFDLSKEGYLNLLAVHQKKSKNPGDNDMMLAARRTFLEQGHYDPLVDALKGLITDELTFTEQKFVALDSGCGEGYYSENVLRKINKDNQVLGTDIAKYAIKNAAKKYKENFYFVSSVFHLPLANDSIDLILSVFAPLHPTEFQRILSNNGYIIVVSPGPNHLKELAELIYDAFRPHQNNVIEKMTPNFEYLKTQRCTFNTLIDSKETLVTLLKMTPYYWSTSKEKLEKITQNSNITITCDFNISIFTQANA